MTAKAFQTIYQAFVDLLQNYEQPLFYKGFLAKDEECAFQADADVRWPSFASFEEGAGEYVSLEHRLDT